MFILYAVALGLVLGLILGGDGRRLAAINIRWSPVILAGLLVQVVLFTDAVASRIGDLGAPIYVASTITVLVAVLRNVRIQGLAVVFVGGLSNLAAIVANGGYMPASLEAMTALGKAPPEIYSNSAVLSSPALQPLTDIFALPRWLPFANVYSIGDVIIAVGVAWTIVAVMLTGRAPFGWLGLTRLRPAAFKTSGSPLGAQEQLTLVRPPLPTPEPLAPWDSRRSVPVEELKFLRWMSVQGKPVVRRGTQS